MFNVTLSFINQHLSGQISINQILDQLRKVVVRFTMMKTEGGKSGKQEADDDEITEDARTIVLLKRATKQFDIASKVLKILSQNFDYGQVLLDLWIKSGAAGTVNVCASKILGKAPLSIWLNLPQRVIYAGIFCPVPYVIGMKSDPEGNFIIEVCNTKYFCFMNSNFRDNISFCFQVEPRGIL